MHIFGKDFMKQNCRCMHTNESSISVYFKGWFETQFVYEKCVFSFKKIGNICLLKVNISYALTTNSINRCCRLKKTSKWPAFATVEKQLQQLQLKACYILPYTIHVRLVCDIYFAHAYLCRCNSKLFCFRKLKPRRLIFLFNCWSNLTMDIVNEQQKKKKSGWLTMPTLTKQNVIFDYLPDSLLLTELKLTPMIDTKRIVKETS